jgi:lysophospholipase L1-like esterase
MMRVWLAMRQYNSQSLPRPLDAPRVCVPGVSSTRVLIFGSGVAVGWGVTSHELALPGALARALTSRSGRGADVEVHADMRITARNALSVLRGLEVEAYDVIIVVLGANDAVAQTALGRWWDGLSAILEHLESRSARRTQLFVAGIPPIIQVPGFGGTVGAIATEHARKINQETRRLCEQWGRATFLPLPLAEGRTAERFGDGRTYRTWAAAMAEIIAPLLHSARWGAHGSLPRDSALNEDRVR